MSDMTDHPKGRPSVAAAAELLRQVRDEVGVTQLWLAERAGVAPSTVAAYESGRHAPSLAGLDRIFAALGRQLRFEADPIDADVDARIDAALALPLLDRFRHTALILPWFLDDLAGVPFVVEGAFAAFVQGAPIPVEAMEIVMVDADLDALGAALTRARAARWSPRWRQWGYEEVDPRVESMPRWRTNWGEVRLRVVEALPVAIEVTVGEHRLAVRPLVEIEVTDRNVQRLLVRLRQRLGSAA